MKTQLTRYVDKELTTKLNLFANKNFFIKSFRCIIDARTKFAPFASGASAVIYCRRNGGYSSKHGAFCIIKSAAALQTAPRNNFITGELNN